MTPEQIRHAILQRLESLQRAGVGQLPRVVLLESRTAAGEQVRTPVVTSARYSASPATPFAPGSPSPTFRPPTGSPMPRPAQNPLSLPTADRSSPAAQKLSAAERRVALEVIQSEVRGCSRCSPLVANRTQTVFGVGTVTPRLCFFGEAPGADEDRQGEPFVGRAGQLLNKIIDAMGLKREEVYILNVLKCRPPDNRAPLDDEIENCRGFFERQLEVLQPEFICCLGASAAKTLLHSAFSLGKMRGRFYDVRGAQVVVTYHPAYLLRNPAAKKDTWEDIQMLMKAMGITARPVS